MRQRISLSATKSDNEKIIDLVDDAAAGLADGDEDEALDILNGIFGRRTAR